VPKESSTITSNKDFTIKAILSRPLQIFRRLLCRTCIKMASAGYFSLTICTKFIMTTPKLIKF
jgi:MarR-like DNA-binding transcriptional regulator SgrR of sgrS sRNA